MNAEQTTEPACCSGTGFLVHPWWNKTTHINLKETFSEKYLNLHYKTANIEACY
jgi:hypothetical protein